VSAAVLAAPQRYKNIGGRDRHVHGWRPEAEDHRTPKLMAAPIKPSWPRAVRNKWVAIKDQGKVGDCTAYGTCSAAEVLGAPPLSEFYQYFYTRLLDGTPANEDSGAQVGTALRSLSLRGCARLSDWASNSPNEFSTPPPPELDDDAGKHKAVLYYRCPDLSTLVGALVAGHPCVFGFKCPENMFGTDCMKTGKVMYPDATEGFEGGHCTGIAGFDLDMQLGNDKGALVLPNSWGTSVGDSGYFYLPTRFVDDGLAGSIYAVVEVML